MKSLKTYLMFSAIAIFLASTSCQDDSFELQEPQKEEVVATNPEEHLEGWIRVKFKEEAANAINMTKSSTGFAVTGIPQVDELAAELGATKVERVFSDGGKFKQRREKYGLHLWYDFYVGESQPMTKSMTKFSALNVVDVVETIPVYTQTSSNVGINHLLNEVSEAVNSQGTTKASQTLPFNDPYLSRQHNLRNQGDQYNWVAGADVNAFPAWNLTAGHPDVIVAVIDGGIDFNHPDLAANMWVNQAELNGSSGRDDDNNGYVDDIHGWRFELGSDGVIKPLDHGTHVAGIIGAVNNNGIGISSIAGGTGRGDGVRIMSCQTFVPNPAYPGTYTESKSTSKHDEAMLYAADNGAVIVSCSWNSGSSLKASYKAAIDYFIETAGMDLNGNQIGPMAGGLVVFSTGNEGVNTMKYPSAYDRTVSVSSIAPNMKLASYSNYGTWINICATGGRNSSAYGGEKGAIYSTIPTAITDANGYGYKQGTSMACPHVSAIAALIVSKYGAGKKGLTPEQVKTRIYSTARNINSYNSSYTGQLGVGLIDAYAALGGFAAPEKPSTSTTWNADNIRVRIKIVPDVDNGPVQSYEFFWGTSSTSGLDPDNPGSEFKRALFTTSETEIDEPVYFNITGLRPATKYHLSVYAVDKYGTRSEPKRYSGTTASN